MVAPLVESRYGPGTNDLIPQRFGSFGGPLSVVWSILSHPGTALATLANREKVQTLFELLAPLGFLPLAGPGILIPALPVVLLNLLAESPWQGTIYAHYFAPAIPFLAVATIHGLDNLTRWTREGLGVFGLETESVAVSCSLALFVLTNALLVAYFLSPFPLGQFFHLANYHQVTAHERVPREIMDTLPAEAKISAQSDLFPHLSQRPVIYLFPIVADAQYVLVDLDPAAEKSPLDWYSFRRLLGDLRQTELYVPARFRDGVLLLERSGGEVVPIDLEGELQSYRDGLFRAEFLAHSTPNALQANQLYVVKVIVANRGTQSWVSKTPYFPVRLSYHWRDGEGKTVVWNGVRTDFPHPVRPVRLLPPKPSSSPPSSQGAIPWSGTWSRRRSTGSPSGGLLPCGCRSSASRLKTELFWSQVCGRPSFRCWKTWRTSVAVQGGCLLQHHPREDIKHCPRKQRFKTLPTWA